MSLRACALPFAALLLGCTVSEAPPAGSASAGAGVGGGASTSASVGVGGSGGGATNHVLVGPTMGSMMLPFEVTSHGSGTKMIGAIDIVSGSGTVVIAGKKLPAVSYRKQPFGQFTLYQTLAVKPDALYVVWLYCEKGKLAYLYYDGTDGTPVTPESSSGTCIEGTAKSTAAVSFPALDFALPPLLAKYTVTGPKVAIVPKEPGSVDLGDGPLTVLPFNDVDCSSCGMPGWREIHTLLWDAPQKRACFAIFYLLGANKPVQVTYSLTLPDLSDPAGVTELEATYSVK